MLYASSKRGIMKIIYLVLDESGSKGYSHNEEKTDGEFGISAGYLIDDASIKEIREKLNVIRSQYVAVGKLHITDLENYQQEEIRNKVFSVLSEAKLPWVYEAIYTQGFHQGNKPIISSILLPISTIKQSIHEEKASLHTELIVGVFVKALAYCIDTYGDDLEIHIISDPIDKSIQKDIESSIREMLNYNQPSTTKFSGYNTKTKKNERGTIEYSLSDPAGILPDYSSIKFTLAIEDSELTLAADILVNACNYYLKNEIQVDPYKNLSEQETAELFPLKENLKSVWYSETGGAYYTDLFYKHPSKSVG